MLAAATRPAAEELAVVDDMHHQDHDDDEDYQDQENMAPEEDGDNNNDNDNNALQESPEGKTSKKRKAAVAVLDESGVTDGQRRVLRQNQRALHRRIEAHTQGNSSALQALTSARTDNNVLFENVVYTREAVLDSENMHIIAAKYVQQVDKMVQVPRYDARKVVTKLSRKCTTRNGSFDWSLMGREIGLCFNGVPPRVTFLAGGLDGIVAGRTRKVNRVARQKAAAPEAVRRPEDVVKNDEEEGKADKLSASEKTLKVVRKVLHRDCTAALQRAKERKAATGQPIPKDAVQLDGVRFLLNPKSFTQSVENIFQYSFLIKKGEAGIRVHQNRLQATVRQNADELPGTTQAVLPFTMRDWRQLCQAYAIDKPTIPHRTGSKISKRRNNNES